MNDRMPNPADHGHWSARLLPVLPILLGTALAFYQLGSKDLWLDEITTVQIATRDLGAILESLKGQHNAPPLYYLILHPFTALGTSEFLMRLPSVFFGATALSACFALARLLFDIPTALLATLLLALSPLHLTYAQEARMYTLFETLSLLSFFFLVRAVQARRRKHWIGYGLVTLASLYTHYFTVFYVVVQGTFLLLISIRRRFFERNSRVEPPIDRKVWSGFVLAWISILLLYLPWLPSALGRSQGGGFRQDLAHILTASLRDLGHGQMTALPYLFAGLFLGGLVACWLNGRAEQGLLLGLWVILPLPLIYLFLKFAQSFFAVRYLLFVLPPYLMGIVYSLVTLVRMLSQRLSNPARAASLCSLALALVAVSLAPLQAAYARPKQAWQDVANFLWAQRWPDEIVLVEPGYSRSCLEYYGLAPTYPVWGEVRNAEHKSATAGGIWFLNWANGADDPRGELHHWLEEQGFHIIIPGSAENGRLWLYYKRSASAGSRDIEAIQPFDQRPVPVAVRHHLAAGQKHQQAEEWELALAQYKEAAELYPDDAQLWFWLGQVHWELDQFDAAIEALQTAIELSPHQAAYHQLLARAYSARRDWVEAERAAETAVKLKAGSAFSHFLLGQAQANQDRWSEALVHYRQAIQLEPDQPWYHIRLGDALVAAGRWSEALVAYDRGLGLEPSYENKSWYHLRRGNAYRLAGETEKAIAAYESVLEIDGTHAQAIEWLEKIRP